VRNLGAIPNYASVPRRSRVVEAGIPLHITARGNYQQTIFHTAGDRAEYLKLLARHAVTERLELLGWCLMTNHVHLLAIPERREALARAMKRTQADYSQRLNYREGRRSGHLWQARFYSCPIGGDALWTVLRYIEQNPVRANLVERAEQWNWSSAAVHCGLQPAPQWLSMACWGRFWTPARWQSVLARGPDERMAAAVRVATRHGLPLGTPEFVAECESRMGRELTARPIGRPRALAAGNSGSD
jgi:putative transposase